MQIDEAIRQAVFYKKPVYIMFPTDIVNQEAIRPRNEINFKVSGVLFQSTAQNQPSSCSRLT